jgi:hypothetical protein
MAIAFANLGASANPDINNSADQTSYANSSWTPPADGMIVVFVVSQRVGGPDTPTISGNGLTWAQIGTPLTFSTSRRLTLFGADATGSSAGVTTIDFGGNTQTFCNASFFHVTGADLSGGVAAAFVQTPTGSDTGTTGSVTLAAAGNAANRPISAWFHLANEATTPTWTEIDDLAGASPVRGLETQYRDDAFDTAAAASWATSSGWGGMAAEIKATVAGTTPVMVRSSMWGRF